MKTFRLGLNLAGRVGFILDIKSKDLLSAAKEWARLTGHNDELFNETALTYFGLKIVKTKLPTLQRKSEYAMFQIDGNTD